jgi:hypothetical protein
VFYGCMSESEERSPFLLSFFIGVLVFALFAFVAIPSFVRDPWTSPANACINNLRRIDAAKNQWVLEHNAKSNDVVTLDDIKPYLEHDLEPNGKPYIKFDAKGNLPKCPSGGIYTIGKVGDAPTCSVGTNNTLAHVLQP